MTQIRSDLVQLMMRKPDINPKVNSLIEDIDLYLKQLVSATGEVFADEDVEREHAIRFYNILLELYLDGFDSLQLQTVVETDTEAEIVDNFKEKIMALMEEISIFM